MDKLIKIPGPDHPIAIEHTLKRVCVTWRGQVVAETNHALTLREARYPAIQYIPREDVDMALLTRSAHQTYCPFKGDCSYFNLPASDDRGINAVWSYEEPFELFSTIKNFIAFYPDRVAIDLV